MNTDIQSHVFFLISSIGFVILGILAAIALIYLIRILNAFFLILHHAEKNFDFISTVTKEIFEDVRDSSVLRFLFKGKKVEKKEQPRVIM